MKTRTLVAVATAAAFAVAACGSDGPSTLSDEDFVEQMGDICSDTERELDRIDEPQALGDLDETAGEAIEVLTDTRERLSDIEPPEDLAADFDDFLENVDDQLAALADLQQAGADEDGEAVDAASADLGQLSQRRSDLGEELGVDECVNDDESTDPTTPAADTTVPVDTAPLTLPPTVAPTVPPETVPAETVPAETAPATSPPSGQGFTMVDLTTIFVAPEGFTLVQSDPVAAQPFIDIVASVPELNTGIEEMGVGVLLDDEDGTAVATIVVGVAIGDAMPGQWKDILCVNGVLRTSASGFTGITCPGPPGSNVADIFTMTEGDLGLSVATLIADLPADLVVDAFFEANFA
jgi:hypothetical protein